jgi:cobalt-zinc-cadmium efflux system outer membrane protein
LIVASTRSLITGVLVGVSLSGCATGGGPPPADVAESIRTRTGANVRLGGVETPAIPAGVQVDDGLSRDEAVAIALWNNAAFQVSASQLGFARADLADAGIISNPVLSLLFPWGPKQLEWTLRWPAEVLWERPKRVAAAKLSAESAAQSLVQSGLDLALAVRLAYADLSVAIDRQRLVEEAAATLQRIDTLTQSRLAAGDIAALDARAARVDAVRSALDADRAVHDVTIARERLRLLLGLGADDRSLERLQDSGDPEPCGEPPDLMKRALATRPDLRAAELTVEAAAARIGWERSRILTLTAVLDANGEGKEGYEMGPGIDVSIPVFNRNQGGRLRGEAELQRASAAYVSLQRQVGLDVREASTLFDQARGSRVAWGERIVTPLRTNLADAEQSYSSGESSYLFVLENSRRLIDARLRERELTADEQRAQARIERASGTACRPAPGVTR